METLMRVREGFTYAGDTDLKVMTCPLCGVAYAIPLRLQENASKRGQGKIQWFCPNGHQLGYHGKSRPERELEKAKADARWYRDLTGRLEAQLDQTTASLRAQKAATTRAKKRHTAGVCPCCKRSFKQLREHMKRKHPEALAEYGIS